MAGGGEKDSEPPGIREDFGGSVQPELKLQDSVRGSINKGLHYVTHLVFLCEQFHSSPRSPQHFTISRLQLVVQRETFYLKQEFK